MTLKILSALVSKPQQIYVSDGQGLNYTLVTSIASNNLTVALKTCAGADPTAEDAPMFNIGAQMLNVTAALSLTITAALGDIFAWDAGKIQGNDAQLFVYLINNNGTPQIGVSPCPTLLAVATNYYSNGTQTGAAGHTNLVMSGIRNATNSCRVIGRVNVSQADNNNWQAPSLVKTINSPVFTTDWLTYVPVFGGFSVVPASPVCQYSIQNQDVLIQIESSGSTGASNATSFSVTAPIIAKLLSNMYWYANVTYAFDNSTVYNGYSTGYIASNSRSIILQRFVGNNTSWTASGAKIACFNIMYRAS